MLSPQELLAQHGIGYIHTAQGKYTTDCPHCRGDGYLNVVIERDGAKWFCHNCDEGGGTSSRNRRTAISGQSRKPTITPMKTVICFSRCYDLNHWGN